MHDSSIDYFINVRPQYLQDGGKKPVSFHMHNNCCHHHVVQFVHLLSYMHGSVNWRHSVPASFATRSALCSVLSNTAYSYINVMHAR
jgi:hypothetical protein